MGVFKQQERRQRRLRARDGAREAAGDAGRSAAAARDATTVSAKDAAPVAAKAKCAPAPADKSRRPARAGAAAAANAGAPAAKEHAGGRKRAAEGAPGGGESGRAGKLKKVEATASKRATAPAAAADKVAEKPKHKQKVLLLGSRGISLRHQELIKDLEALLPHSKKDSKLDTKSNLKLINELAELNNCNGCMFFEARRREDLYLWLAKTPNGPSFKFQVQDVHTMNELRMIGNCLKGTRHILSFDKTFDGEPHLLLMKRVFTQLFAVPRTSRRLKPFIDHIISFTVADRRVWVRNYQIVENPPPATSASDSEAQAKKKSRAEKQDVSLVEIGPRFVLNPIRIFAGSFGGRTVYANPWFTSPARIRAATRRMHAARYKSRQFAEAERKEKIQAIQLEEDPLDEMFQ